MQNVKFHIIACRLRSFKVSTFRAKEWVILTRRQDLLKKKSKYLHQNSKLCSEHFEECMFSNEAKTRLKRDAKPTLFNIPNAPAKVGLKRRRINREPETQFQGNSNEILLLDDVLVFHRAKENSFIKYLHNF